MKRMLTKLVVSNLILSSAAIADWTEITSNFPEDFPGYPMLSRMASDGTRLYVAGNSGVYVTEDDGSSFTKLTNVTSSTYSFINTPTFVTYENGYIWAGIDASGASGSTDAVALFRLTPGSTSWEKAVDAPVGNLQPGQGGNVVDDLAYDASTGIYYLSSGGGSHLFTSVNGTTWTVSTNGIQFTGSVPSTVAAKDGVALHNTQNTVTSRLYKSGDNGATWAELSPGFFPSLTLEFAHNGNIVSSSEQQDGLYYSTDDGANWTKIPVTDLGPVDLHVEGNTVIAAGHLSYFIWVPFKAARDNYLAYSTDGGVTYSNLDQTGLAEDLAIYESMVSNGKLYIIGINLSGSGPLKSFYCRPLSELGLAGGGTDLSFADFAASNFPVGQRGPLDDGNTNGLSNGAEFVFGIDDGDFAKLPQLELQAGSALGTGDSNTYMTVVFRIRKDSIGYTYTPRASNVLSNLSAGASNTLQVGSPVDDGDVEIHTYRSTFSVESSTNGFMDVQLNFN